MSRGIGIHELELRRKLSYGFSRYGRRLAAFFVALVSGVQADLRCGNVSQTRKEKVMGDTSPEVLHLYTDELLLHAGFEATCNREDIEASDFCACYACGRYFFPDEVKRFDSRSNALCPFCSEPAVLPTAAQVPLSPGFLALMRKRWVRKPRRSGS